MLGSLLVVDWAPNAGEGDKMLFIFDGGELAPDQEASIRLQSAELSEYAFTDPERFDEVLIPRLSRRLRLAIDAHRHGRPIYAEHGASASHATA